ncbi:MAG: type II secretion system secretin GspD [Betaproteobacteria bacterium]|nr:type II secretion system secretin GspD [Betaproteobacteria bacterium]
MSSDQAQRAQPRRPNPGAPRTGAAAIRALLLAIVLVQCPVARAAEPPPGIAGSSNQITLNFREAEIDVVVAAFSHLMGRAFIVDPKVRGKMTLEIPKPVSRTQAYQLLQAQLRLQGFALVEAGQTVRVVPEADAKLQNGPVAADRTELPGGDQIVTQIFRLSYESASNLVPVLRPLVGANNPVTAYPSNNSLVITDYASNLQRIGKIIASLDSPSTGEVEVIPVRHGLATDLATSVTRLLDDTQRAAAGAQVDPGQRITVLADARLNSVLVRAASPARLNLAKSLIARLDQPSEQPGNIRVVYLRNAEAVRLAQVLRSVIAGDTGGGTGVGTLGQGLASLSQGTALQPAGTAGATAPGAAPGSAITGATSGTATPGSTLPGAVAHNVGGVIIAADAATNSLIITAPEPVYRNLRAVIDRLDSRRMQVYIESLIVEVSAERAAELGIQWQFLSQSSGGGNSVVGGTNLPARNSGGNILDATANVLALGQGLNLGLLRSGAIVGNPGASGGISPVNLGLLARALESGANANILATPNLLTLDNEEARIIIGQNVPFITGQFTATGTGGAAVSPFQTIERRDVGTTLRVKPQVSEAGTIRLQIFQEVSNVQDRSLSAGLITNRRAIESNVLVDDGQVVVLGGLIEERVEGGTSKVPGLGDIPVLGQLFRYDNRKRVKTNLLVFLRPVVLRDANAAQSLTADRYDYMRTLQGDSRLPPRWLLPDMPPSVLPAMPKPAGPSPLPPGAPASLSPDIDGAARR